MRFLEPECITDVISIIVFNQNNTTKSKAINIPITLRTTEGVPIGFSQNPTTQNFNYNNLVVKLTNPLKVLDILLHHKIHKLLDLLLIIQLL